MRKQKRLVIGVGITAFILLFGYLFIYLIFPLMLAGPPLPLYYIRNNSDENHTIVVEIFDENNISVLHKMYNILPGEKVKHNRGIGWYPKPSWYLITWPEGKYTFYFTLDNEYLESYTDDVFPTCTLDVDLFYVNPRTNETIPIEIGGVCV